MKLRFFVLSVFLFIGSCSTKPKKVELKPAPPPIQDELASAQNDLNKGREKNGVNKLKALAQAHPGTDVSDTAWTLIGRVYFKHKDYKSASIAYLQILNGTASSPHAEEAYLNGTKSLVQLGRVDEALSISGRALASNISPAAKLELEKMRYPLQKDTGDLMGSLVSLMAVYDAEPDPNQKIILRNRSFDIANKLGRKELEEVVSKPEFSLVRGFAGYRLGVFYIERREVEKARDYFTKTVEYCPNTNIATQAQNYLSQIEGRKLVDPYVVGAVIPLSGKYEALGRKSLQGLQMGLGIYGDHRGPYKLAVLDSEGSPDEAKKSVETLVMEDHAVAVVGSLMSRTSVPVATKANELGVASIALSQKSGITEIGTSVFRNAVTSAMQVQHLVRVAMEDMGMKRFAILFPNDSYGVEYANFFWDEVEKRGGVIAAAQPYSTTETDFRAPVKRLVGTYYLEDRVVEYKARVKEWFKGQKTISGRKSPPDDLLPAIVDFDAIFVPDGPKAMGQIAPMLAYVGVMQMKYLGTNLWNTPEFVRRGERRVESALFVDSQITNDPRFSASRFFVEFRNIFGSEPGMFELQGYETGRMLRQVLDSGERSRVGVIERLSRLEKVQGVLGPMQMSGERELMWPLTTFTVSNGEIVPLVKTKTSSM